MGILWAPPVDTVRVQSTVTQTEVLFFDNYSGLLAFELVFSFFFYTALSLFCFFCLCLNNMRRTTNMNVNKYLLVLLGLSLTLSACVVTAEEEGGDDAFKALELTIDNFDDKVGGADLSGVFFYAPWCGHCKKAKPEWAEAAKMLEEDNIPLFAVNLDEDENRPLAQKYQIQGFPTIMIFKKAKLDQADEALLKSKDLDHTKVTVIAFLDNTESEDQKNFEDAVDAIRGDGIYYFTDNYEIAKVIHEDVVVKPNTLLLFRHSDGGIAKSDGVGSVEDVLRFIDTNYASPFLEFSQMSKGIADKVYRGAFKYNIFMYAAEDKKEEIGAWASKIPEKFAGKVSPAVIFDAKSSESRIGQYFSFDDALDLSIAVVDLNAESGGKFIMQESATEKSAFQFIEDVLAGNVEPTLKSEPIPESNSDPVKVVVGKTFEDIVLSGSNVLLEIYAPWCGHCKALTPIYEELANELEGDEEVVIAKIDGTANDITDGRFKFTGFPTLYFIDSKGKVSPYSDAREKDAMKQFVEENKTPLADKPVKKEL